MGPGDATSEPSPEGIEAPREGRIRHTLSGWRRLARIGFRDPEHIAERLTLFAANNLGEPSLRWAREVREARPETPRPVIAEELRTQSAQVARIDGAVAGTPFLIALVPGYLSYLWQEGRMVLRIAALYDRDPRVLDTSAEVLALRGVHPTPEAARAALLAVRDSPLPEKPARRRPLRTWVRSVYAILIFGGFLSAPSSEGAKGEHHRLKAAAGFVVGGAIWVTTWVLPVTFMIAMAWGCETHARQLGRRALIFYDGEADSAREAIAAAKTQRDRGHDRRQVLRTALLLLSVALPVGFVAYVNHVRQTAGVNWLAGVGGLVALSLVIATTVIASRR